MAYMLLIVEPVGQRAERGLERGQKAYETMLGFTAGLKAAGVLMASSSLASRAEALAWAGRCPAAAWATVEVRETGPCFT